LFDRILKRMREKVRTRQYVMTLHAEEEMNDDGLSILDVEGGILAGKIIKRQKDRFTEEWTYLIEGETNAGDRIVIVAKSSMTGKLVIITLYLA